MKKIMKKYDKHEVVLFNSHAKGEEKVLSNFYPCTIVLDDIKFGSSEQLFQYLIYTGNEKVQEKILKSSTPQKAKQLGKYYESACPISEEEQIEIMRFCLRLKYEQCPEFGAYLGKHIGDTFVEYAPWGDTFWGMDDVDKAFRYVWNYGEVCGRNVTGTIVQEICDAQKKPEKAS